MHSLLEQGLGDRAKSIRVVWRNANQGSYVEDVCFFFLPDLRLPFNASKIVLTIITGFETGLVSS